MERKLATIRRISNIEPIEGADKIELCTVDNWKVVTAKDVGHQVGDLVVYCEIDSFLPTSESEYEFLRKSSYKKLSDGTEGYRIKSVRLRSQLSQGLILPLSLLSKYGNLVNEGEELFLEIKSGTECNLYIRIKLEEGVDLTEILHITKWEAPLGAVLSGLAKGLFPSHIIRKTDEERVQNLTKFYESYKAHTMYVTEKLDGSSATYFLNNGEFGACSRNLELSPTEDGNTFWRVARELDLENKLREFGYNIALQGELIGEGIQGNPYKIKGQTVKFFNIFDIGFDAKGFRAIGHVLLAVLAFPRGGNPEAVIGYNH
jgi:tRNA-binding EMAP/Myf-like protein